MLRTLDSYDAVTLDILMPGMGGRSAGHEIRDDPDLHGIPIVFVSVFAGRRELAGEWVVSKPIDADELRNVLAAAVESGRSRVLVVGGEQVPPDARAGPGRARDRVPVGAHRRGRRPGVRRAALRGGARRRRDPQPPGRVQALDLRGRRLRRAAILFSDGRPPPRPESAAWGSRSCR